MQTRTVFQVEDEIKSQLGRQNKVDIRMTNTDADSIIFEVVSIENGRGKRNFDPNILAELISIRGVFDVFVQENSLFIHVDSSAFVDE